ncbi:MAG: type II toxin-antitoxin system RelE family toxin [Thermoleophilaceae bacterium]
MSAEGAWGLRYTRRAEKDLRRLDPPVRRRVVAAVERLAAGDERADVRGLAAREANRLRHDEDRRLIVVMRVLPRGRAYER